MGRETRYGADAHGASVSLAAGVTVVIGPSVAMVLAWSGSRKPPAASTSPSSVTAPGNTLNPLSLT